MEGQGLQPSSATTGPSLGGDTSKCTSGRATQLSTSGTLLLPTGSNSARISRLQAKGKEISIRLPIPLFYSSPPPARFTWYIPQSLVLATARAVDWLGILERAEETQIMANGKTWWAARGGKERMRLKGTRLLLSVPATQQN